MTTIVPFFGPGFRLDVPSTWMVFATGDSQASFMMPPYDPNRAKTLMVSMSRVADATDAYEVAGAALRAQESNYEGFVHLSGDTSNQQPLRVIQRVRWQPPEGEAVVQHHLFCVADEGHLIYALTATRPEDMPDDEAEAWGDEVDAVLKSFALTEPQPM